jgi:hypothetical protein
MRRGGCQLRQEARRWRRFCAQEDNLEQQIYEKARQVYEWQKVSCESPLPSTSRTASDLELLSLDSPASYVQGLNKLFGHSQLLDEHSRALLSHPMAPAYTAFPHDIRGLVDQRLKRSSEFFATVVLTFVIRDLSQLLDKYVKKCEKWLAE